MPLMPMPPIPTKWTLTFLLRNTLQPLSSRTTSVLDSIHDNQYPHKPSGHGCEGGKCRPSRTSRSLHSETQTSAISRAASGRPSSALARDIRESRPRSPPPAPLRRPPPRPPTRDRAPPPARPPRGGGVVLPWGGVERREEEYVG